MEVTPSPRRTTLCFLLREPNEILFIEKKRGMGAGKWNGPGGKVAPHETSEEGARREVREETGLRCGELRWAGHLAFRFAPESSSWANDCEVFVCRSFDGDLVPETEECRSFWWPRDAIPYERFWPDDRLWMPKLLAGEPFRRLYEFDAHDRLLREMVNDP